MVLDAVWRLWLQGPVYLVHDLCVSGMEAVKDRRRLGDVQCYQLDIFVVI